MRQFHKINPLHLSLELAFWPLLVCNVLYTPSNRWLNFIWLMAMLLIYVLHWFFMRIDTPIWRAHVTGLTAPEQIATWRRENVPPPCATAAPHLMVADESWPGVEACDGPTLLINTTRIHWADGKKYYNRDDSDVVICSYPRLTRKQRILYTVLSLLMVSWPLRIAYEWQLRILYGETVKMCTIAMPRVTADAV